MKKSLIYVALSTVLFSLMEIALKVAGNQFNPIQLNLIRFALGGLVILPFAIMRLRQQHHRLHLADWKIFSLTGFLCVVISMTLYQLAIVYGEPAIVAVLFSCNPVFALIFAYLILHEAVSRTDIISLVLSVVGLLVIIDPFKLTDPIGISLAILAAATFGFYSIMSQASSLKVHLDGVVMTSFTFIAGALELLVLILITKLAPVAQVLRSVSWLRMFADIPIMTNVNLANLPILLFVGVAVTGGGFAFYFLALQQSGVSIASLVFFFKPVLSPIFAFFLIGEAINLPTMIGIAIIIVGSIVTLYGYHVQNRDEDELLEK
ncbi:DMT family transporter [Fructilactobacillus florum]|uniref:DMT family transporter n=1 Tax=Fructilactobacillus florum TaxID=640331 RepID=UPI00028E2A6E|nr:DMT family transporter [Fructilactobacillus florum]EKK20985.1 Permease of the drug, metabolite transporter (DMT) superfamily [Fructilactobacillus florum 2F]